MSAIEDPAVTIERLLRKKMRVILDSGALARVDVSAEYSNNDALRAGNAQVTVGLVESVYQKLDLSGKICQHTSTVRVNSWATDTSAVNESGKSMRNKIVSEISLVINESRATPNLTTYDFLGFSAGSKTCKALSGDVEAAPNSNWTELSATDYQSLWYSDDSRCQIRRSVNGSYAVLLLGLRLESRRDTIQKIVLTFEGFGASPAGYGVTIKVWNNTASEWQNERSHVGNGIDQTFTITIASNPSDFIDQDGYVWLLARTTHPSDGSQAATLSCNYASCTTVVNGITHCNVASSRNLDHIDLKPPIYRTEFTVKTQIIQNNGV